MPRNASTGVYTPPSNSWNPATPDTVISSADWNAMRADMAAALDHAPATTRALHPTTGQVQDGAFIWGGTAGGTADALTLTLTPAITAYAAGMVVRFIAAADNTSATPTLAINGVTPAVIARDNGNNLAAGDITAGNVYEVLYSGTHWRLTSITIQQANGNDGAQSVSGTSLIELTDYANAAQFVAMTVEGASVHLPDATLQSVGKAKFTIVNNGNADFFVRPSRKMPLQNGNFANSASWTLGTGWSIGGGVATKAPGTASDLSQPLVTEENATYEITFSITTISGGSVCIGLTGGGADVLGTPRSAPGTYTEILRSNGNTTFVLRADAAFDANVDNVVCKRNEPLALSLLRPKQSASFSLLSNSTPHGVWAHHDEIASVPKLSGTAPGPAAITTILTPSCALNDYQVLHFGRNSSNHLFAYVVEYKSTGLTVGTPTLVSTTNVTLGGAHLVAHGKVLFCYGSDVYLASINGTTVTISSAVAANVFNDKRTTGVGPKHAQIGNTVVIGNQTLQAVDCNGTTPVAGSAVTIGVGSTNVIGVFSQPSDRVVCFYSDDSGTPGSPFSIRGRVATLSGTTITPHTSSGINDVDIADSYGVLEFSKELYLIAYKISFSQASVVVATVSGTSVTFHMPVSFSVTSGNLYPPNAFQNEMFQKLSDTEAVMFFTGNANNITFAYITINGTTLTVNTADQPVNFPTGGGRSLILSRKKKLYYNIVTANASHVNRTIFSLEYNNNTLSFRRIPNIRVAERLIKINECGFVAPFIDDLTQPADQNNTRLVFVSTKTETEQLFPIFCQLNISLRAEEITSQKTALYGESLPAGKRLHYLIEGVF
jgi:hypothetical protein